MPGGDGTGPLGFGRGGYGRRFWGGPCGYYTPMWRQFAGYSPYAPYAQMPERERDVLESEAAALREDLKAIERRLGELEKSE